MAAELLFVCDGVEGCLIAGPFLFLFFYVVRFD